MRTSRNLSLASTLVAAVALSTLYTPSPGASAAPAESAPSTTLVQDSFDRSTARSWGKATTGSTWSTSGSGSWSTSAGAGWATVSAGKSLAAAQPVRQADVRGSVIVSYLSAVGGAQSGLAVRSDGGRSYQATLQFVTDKEVRLRVARVEGSTRTILKETRLTQSATRGQNWRIDVHVAGATKVDIAARAWVQGRDEPDWQIRVVDSSSRRLAAAGGMQILSAAPKTAVAKFRYESVGVAAVKGAATTKPAPPAAPPAAEPAPPAATGQRGALEPGRATYPVPAGAIFVADKGNASGSGTRTSPYGSLAHAVSKAKSGSTLVLRAGRYHESVTIPFYRALTIQNYPGEAVWLDGSERLTGWKASGGAWYAAWKHDLINTVSYTPGKDESSRYVDPAHPMSRYPEQVWVNGAKLTQVGSRAAVRSNTFFVDRSARRLWIGTSPSSKTVEASTLAKGLRIQGRNSVVRGIGVQRYASHLSNHGAVSAEVPNVRLENVVVQDNATIGLMAWNTGKVIDRVTLRRNGMMGLSVNKADGLRMSNSVVAENNIERFKPAPASGGAKITESDGVVIERSSFVGNVYAGLWFDVYGTDIQVTGSTFRKNTGSALQLELSTKVSVVGNYMTENATGLRIINSSHVSAWNNTIARNSATAVKMNQDSRYGASSLWFVKSIQLRNNVIGLDGRCAVIYDDQTRSVHWDRVSLRFDDNLWHRRSASAPERLVCLPHGSAGMKAFRSWAELRALGWEPSGRLVQGSHPLDGKNRLVSTMTAQATAVATPVPSTVAAQLGVRPGWVGLGPTVAHHG